MQDLNIPKKSKNRRNREVNKGTIMRLENPAHSGNQRLELQSNYNQITVKYFCFCFHLQLFIIFNPDQISTQGLPGTQGFIPGVSSDDHKQWSLHFTGNEVGHSTAKDLIFYGIRK